VPTSASTCDFGWEAADFRLPATDGRNYTLHDIRGPKGALIVFICNHCPYVKGIIDRLVRDAAELAALGVGTAAISSNDAVSYPEDSFDNMKIFAAEHHFPFPYLYDESQDVARAYGALCTPDFFGFNAGLKLQYRGRLDESRKTGAPGARRELFEAMREIARTGQGPREQIPSIGCSIKWKN
jgi:peroxiredoxin